MFIVIRAGIWEQIALNVCTRQNCTDVKNRIDGFETKISYQSHSKGNEIPVKCLDRDWNYE